MRRPQLSENEKQEIIKEVCDNNRTVTCVAKLFDRDKKTIYNLVRKYREGEHIQRTVKLTNREKADICSLVEENPSITAPELRDKLDLDVSLCTIRRYLIEHGFVCENTIRPKRVRV